MHKPNRTYKLLVCFLPVAIIVLGYFTARFVIDNFTLPECFFLKLTGCYCPGCGNTRAVIALVNGDIFLSIRQNPIIIIMLFTAVLLYSEVVVRAFGKIWRSPIRNYYYLYGVMAVLGIFYVLRNFIPMLAPI